MNRDSGLGRRRCGLETLLWIGAHGFILHDYNLVNWRAMWGVGRMLNVLDAMGRKTSYCGGDEGRLSQCLLGGGENAVRKKSAR